MILNPEMETTDCTEYTDGQEFAAIDSTTRTVNGR